MVRGLVHHSNEGILVCYFYKSNPKNRSAIVQMIDIYHNLHQGAKIREKYSQVIVTMKTAAFC